MCAPKEAEANEALDVLATQQGALGYQVHMADDSPYFHLDIGNKALRLELSQSANRTAFVIEECLLYAEKQQFPDFYEERKKHAVHAMKKFDSR